MVAGLITSPLGFKGSCRVTCNMCFSLPYTNGCYGLPMHPASLTLCGPAFYYIAVNRYGEVCQVTLRSVFLEHPGVGNVVLKEQRRLAA